MLVDATSTNPSIRTAATNSPAIGGSEIIAAHSRSASILSYRKANPSRGDEVTKYTSTCPFGGGLSLPSASSSSATAPQYTPSWESAGCIRSAFHSLMVGLIRLALVQIMCLHGFTKQIIEKSASIDSPRSKHRCTLQSCLPQTIAYCSGECRSRFRAEYILSHWSARRSLQKMILDKLP